MAVVWLFEVRLSLFGKDVLDKIPKGAKIVVGNFGGTNWQTGIARFEKGRVAVEIKAQKIFPQNERCFSIPEEWAQAMLDLFLQIDSAQIATGYRNLFGFSATSFFWSLGFGSDNSH